MNQAQAQTKEADRTTVVIAVRYETECEDEILGIHEAAERTYEGVTDVRAQFAWKGHEPEPMQLDGPANWMERDLLAQAKTAYDAWNKSVDNGLMAFGDLPERAQAMWADAIASVVL